MIFGEKPPKIVCDDPEITIDLSAPGANSSFTEYNFCIPDYILHTSIKTGKRQLLQRGITDKHYAGFKIKIWGLNIGDYETKYKPIDGKVIAFMPHADLLSSFNCIVLNVKPYYKNSMNFKDAVIITLISESYYEPSVIIRDGLVGYWPLYKIYYKDGKILDLSGYENHGIFHGEPNPIFVPDHNGKADRAISFDGIDDYVDCGDVLRDSGENTYEKGIITAWFKPKGPWYNYNTIFDNSVGRNDWEMWICSTGILNTKIAEAGTKLQYNLNNLEGPDHWYHIVLTWEKTGNKKLYIQGILRDTKAVTWQESGANFYLASGNAGNTQGKGLIGEVRIYSRILSEDEIRKIHQGQG